MWRASVKGSGGASEGGGALSDRVKRCLCVCGMRETAPYSLIMNLPFQVAELIPCRSHNEDINYNPAAYLWCMSASSRSSVFHPSLPLLSTGHQSGENSRHWLKSWRTDFFSFLLITKHRLTAPPAGRI